MYTYLYIFRYICIISYVYPLMYVYMYMSVCTYICVCVCVGVEAGPRTIFVIETCHAYSISAFSFFQGCDSEHEVRLYDIYLDIYILCVCV